ncbi:MAG: hypothetical protein WDO71_00485 [Bacteroidota bacterium]
MTPSQKYLAKLGLKDQDGTEERPMTNNKTEEQENSRRSFF